MKILYYDCFAGISGDMNLAALLDLGPELGVSEAHLRAELAKLPIGEEFELRVSRDERGGIRGTRLKVHLTRHDPHDHDHGHAHAQAHEHRTLADVTAIIRNSELEAAVKATSLKIFRRVAEAEAKVHGTPVDEVHFHEVGATDSIVDIVGAAICYHALKIDAVWARPLELGAGTVRCAHGTMPVPAPATEEILTGLPTTRGATPHEATTPTGAAILAELADRFVAAPEMTVMQTAYGVGHRITELPNLLRVQLAEVQPEDRPTNRACLLQCNIDDMTAEQLGAAMEALLDAGAMDVHFTPAQMKKNRPGTCLSLLCAKADAPRFTELIFRHTSTLGVKRIPVDKTELERRFETVETPHGPVTMKYALLSGEVLRGKPEYEDLRAIARREGISLDAAWNLVAEYLK